MLPGRESGSGVSPLCHSQPQLRSCLGLVLVGVGAGAEPGSIPHGAQGFLLPLGSLLVGDGMPATTPGWRPLHCTVTPAPESAIFRSGVFSSPPSGCGYQMVCGLISGQVLVLPCLLSSALTRTPASPSQRTRWSGKDSGRNSVRAILTMSQLRPSGLKAPTKILKHGSSALKATTAGKTRVRPTESHSVAARPGVGWRGSLGLLHPSLRPQGALC